MRFTRKGSIFLNTAIPAIIFILLSITVYADGGDTWETKAPMANINGNPQIAVMDGKIYVIGGFDGVNSVILNSIEEYNPATNTWTTKAPLPAPRRYHQVAVVAGKIYIIGGSTESSLINTTSVEEYDPATNTWTTKAPMITARRIHEIAVVNEKIYVIGGSNNAKGLNSVEEYDPATNTWTAKAPMNVARTSFQAAVVNGKIYAIGGHDSAAAFNSVEEYDPATDTWTTKAPMNVARHAHKAAVIGEKIYVIGGYNNSVEEYDPATNTWTTKASMNVAREAHQVVVVNGRIYAIGGRVLNSVEEYDPVIDTWTLKAPMTTARYLHQAAAVNGKIYAMGGRDDTSSLNSVEEYIAEGSIPQGPTDLVATAGISQVSLSWAPVTGEATYNVKRSTIAGGPYTTIASDVDTTYYTDSSVTNGTEYFYVVTAINAGAESGNSNEASAAPTSPSIPQEPTNLVATAGISQVNLSWAPVTGAATYNVKRAAIAGGHYTTIASGVDTTHYTDSSVTNGTTYFYVVTAIITGAESGNSNEASATPTSSTPVESNRAILEITMINGSIKEYDLSATEINSFLTWYDDKENGVAGTKGYFSINKSYNIKPFLSRKEYITFSKIQDFEIKEYNDAM